MIRVVPLALLLGSCGAYEIGGLYDEETRSVRVEIFDNVSERRTHEFDLTNAVIHEMITRGLRVNTRDAAYTLKGRILDIRNPQAVAGQLDTVLVGSLLFRVEITLVGPDGKARWRDERTETASFTAARSETLESSRQQVFDRLARWVVTHFEKEW